MVLDIFHIDNLGRKLIFSIILLLLHSFSSVWAATNTGRGNLGADPALPDIDFVTDSPTLTVTSANLAVVKVAFVDDNTGTQIADGSTVAAGVIIKFIIYVDNTTTATVNDVRIDDFLNDVGFTYQVGSLLWNNNITATVATLATIFTDTNGGIALTDTVSVADVGSANIAVSPDSITFGAYSTQVNAALNIPAGTIASFMFRARAN